MTTIRSLLEISIRGALLVVLPIYISLLLLAKALSGVRAMIHPLTLAIPQDLIHPDVAAVLVLFAICFLTGAAIQTHWGKSASAVLSESVFGRIPGYRLLRDLFRRLAGEQENDSWAVAMVEIEEALVPAFVVEKLDDGRYTVFVPSVPTPAAGSIYVLPPERVHLVDVPLTDALRCITKWGAGTGKMVAAMKKET